MKKVKKHLVNVSDMFEEFKENKDIFNDEEDLVKITKYIIWNKLDDTERRVLLLYVEIGNLRDTAKILNVSTSTVCNFIREIKNKIKELSKDKDVIKEVE